jgi:ribosome biogenesis GTPase
MELRDYLRPGQTLVMLGSSGAGKSTLTNTLLGQAVQATRAVRHDDSRGRHTTTARSLHRLAGGACVIDTPGLRGLEVDTSEEGLRASFADLAALAEQCRFRDCTHADEPDCAVRRYPSRSTRQLPQTAPRGPPRSMTFLDRRRQLAEWKARGRAADLRMKMKRG